MRKGLGPCDPPSLIPKGKGITHSHNRCDTTEMPPNLSGNKPVTSPDIYFLTQIVAFKGKIDTFSGKFAQNFAPKKFENLPKNI